MGKFTNMVQISSKSDCGEIWIILIKLHEKNNEIGQNILVGHEREPWGAVARLKIQINPILMKFGPYM